MLRDFKKSHTQGPDVGSDGVRLASDSFWGHVIGCADEGVCITLGTELATDTEVAQFDLAISAQENIRWFDI